MVLLRLLLVLYRCLYLENNFDSYETPGQLDLTSSVPTLVSVTLQRLLLLNLPVLFNYYSMREK